MLAVRAAIRPQYAHCAQVKAPTADKLGGERAAANGGERAPDAWVFKEVGLVLALLLGTLEIREDLERVVAKSPWHAALRVGGEVR